MTEFKTKTAKQVLDELGFNSPPFDPFKVAEGFGFVIDDEVTVDLLSRAGSISKKDNKIFVWVNPFDPKVRQNFTVAHELGHYFNGDLNTKNTIEDTPATLYRTEGDLSNCEKTANKFAAELLMPQSHIYDQARIIIDNAPNNEVAESDFIKKMAGIFNVSKAAMTYRLRGFGIISSGY